MCRNSTKNAENWFQTWCGELRKFLEDMERTLTEGNGLKTEMAGEYLSGMEKIYLTFRQGLEYSSELFGVPNILPKEEIRTIVYEAEGISLIREWYGYALRLPSLLPGKLRTRVIDGNVMDYLADYVKKNPVEKITECVVVTRQIYHRKSQLRDCDNAEYSQILNCLGTYLIRSDDGESCYQMHLAAVSETEEPHTEIYVVKKDQFLYFWLFMSDEHGNFSPGQSKKEDRNLLF